MINSSTTSPKTILRPSLLLSSICTATLALALVGCETDSTETSANSLNANTEASTQQDANVVSQANYSESIEANKAAASRYLVGAGIADITGAAAQTGMFGYSVGQDVEGINDRLYSHAFIIGDINNPDNRVAYVSADLGAMFTSIKLEVIKRLQDKYGDLYNDDNVLLSATHTHVGTAGISHQELYQIASKDDTTAGYSTQNFNAVVDGIVRSIERANDNLTPGSLSLAQGELKGATKNRSAFAYDQNPEAKDYDSNVNETMTQLRLNAEDGTPIGLINWFAIHPTSFSNKFEHLSADNKGYAQLEAEKKLALNSDKPFVAAFANADEGDVVSIGGNANSSEGFQGSDNEWENVIKDGEAQINKAVELWDQGKPVDGPVDYRARWVDLKGYQVDAKFTNGAGNKVLCQPAQGYSFAVGAENGPTFIPGLYEGMTRESFRINDDINKVDQSLLGTLTRGTFSLLSNIVQDDCQEEKQILLPVGEWGWVNTQQPVQIIRIGNLAIISIPVEPTTMVGRRLRAAVYDKLKDTGVDTVIVNGLANNYSGYLTTPEEYAVQHYEGASTAFGKYELSAYLQEYSMLADAMRNGTEVYDLTTPPDRSGEKFQERAGVVFDDKPLQEEWGQTLVQPNPSYHKGDKVSVVFRGAHPKNNLRTEDTFLKVQRLEDGEWVDYLSDRDFDTMYTWKRDGVSYSKVTIDWRIGDDTPAGTYRIQHQGDWKNGWNYEISPYSGTSNEFVVE